VIVSALKYSDYHLVGDESLLDEYSIGTPMREMCLQRHSNAKVGLS